MSVRDPDANDPWGGLVDAKHLFGPWWFVNRYGESSWWTIAAFLAVIVPPAGVFMLVYMLTNCITNESEDLEFTDSVNPL